MYVGPEILGSFPTIHGWSPAMDSKILPSKLSSTSSHWSPKEHNLVQSPPGLHHILAFHQIHSIMLPLTFGLKPETLPTSSSLHLLPTTNPHGGPLRHRIIPQHVNHCWHHHDICIHQLQQCRPKISATSHLLSPATSDLRLTALADRHHPVNRHDGQRCHRTRDRCPILCKPIRTTAPNFSIAAE